MIEDGMRPRGFTMVEMMIAIALLAMMTSIIYVAMRLNFRAREGAYRVQRVYHQADVSLNRMRRALSMAFVSKHVDEEKSRETMFVGKTSSVQFDTLAHLRIEQAARESDQAVVEFFLGNDKETGEKALFMRENPVIDDNPDSGGKVVKLAERVKSLKFSYYDKQAEDWEGDWKAELAQGEEVAADRQVQAIKKSVGKLTGAEEMDEFRLPDAIRIELVLRDEDDNEYPFATALKLPMPRAFDW
jgi:prepilin-type N-terminal cleavage/methylation domain-containing protein